MDDISYMKLALDLARMGEGKTAPNPMVGAVIVKDNRIIGKGYHTKHGALHAEREAFASLTESAEGATLYVTLEPCCHYGKTPPCTEAIIEHHIKRVVVAVKDPNPLVAGKGLRILEEHGIEVTTGVLEKEALELNRVFFHYITHKTPYIVMKYAMSADGKIACHTGLSKWITGSSAREHVHMLRNRYRAIMVGIGTVLADDPMLNCRMEGGVDPIRIICDTSLRIPLSSNIVKTALQIPTYIICHTNDTSRKAALESAGAHIIEAPLKDGKLDLVWLMEQLGSLNIDSVLVEGGGTLNESLLKANLVNALMVYIAPKIIGGSQSKTPVEGIGFSTPDEAIKFNLHHMKQIGEDILLEYITK